MVDGELTQAVLAGVGVTFGDNPSGGIGYAEVDDFARRDEVVEGLHYFRDAGVHVPEMNVELRENGKGK